MTEYNAERPNFDARKRAGSGPSISQLAYLLLIFASQCCLGFVQAAQLTVDVRDALSGTAIANQPVAVFDKSGSGELTWKGGGTTNAAGRAIIEVTSPAPGNILVARTRPFAMWVEQPVSPGTVTQMLAGRVRVQVLHGVTGAPLGNTPVVLGNGDPTGQFNGTFALATDAAGQLRLDPSGLGSTPYLLRAISPVDGSHKFSAPINAPGDIEFRVGNPGVTVNLTDWSSNAPLTGQRVEVRERMPDGELRWLTSRETDGNGRVKLDLDGLDHGRRYVVRVRPYLQPIERDVSAAGWINISAGTVPVMLINGDTDAAMANTKVMLHSRPHPTAAWSYEFEGTTGADGKLVFDPPHLNSREYALHANSLVDGSMKRSEAFSSAGPITFAVGNRRLSVRIVNAKNNSPIAALVVTANEVLNGGAFGPTIARHTDANGVARFDLEGLGQGKRYRIRSKPFTPAIEHDVSSTGWVEVSAGALRVRVQDGANGASLGGRKVQLFRLRSDGSRQGIEVLNTTSDGQLILDLPDLGATRYQLSAESPIDGTTKFSQILSAPGDTVFSVGSAGVTVHVRDFRSGNPLPNQLVSIFERTNGGSLTWVANRATDSAGLARFDLDGVGSRQYLARVKPYTQTIEQSISSNGTIDIRAGSLRVDVRRGDNGQAYPNAPVRLLAVRENGEYEGVLDVTSSPTGELILDPERLGSNRYVLRARSPIDGSFKYSQVISSEGDATFSVGNVPLQVRLIDFQSRAPIPNSILYVLEVRADGSSTWLTQRVTDAQGNVVLDLDGLGKGRNYLIRAHPFAQWLERVVGTTQAIVLEGGRSTVLLLDSDSGRPMPGVSVQARTKAADGSLSNAVSTAIPATTDANGQVRFDPPELGNGGVAVFTALDPFGNGVNYHSAPSIHTGLTRFDVSRGGPRHLDRTPTELDVTLPRVDQRVSLGGIVLNGYVSDDTAVRDVSVEILNGSVLLGRYRAQVDPDTRRWSFRSPSLGVSNNTKLSVRVVATDFDYNSTTKQFTVTAIQDVTPPALSFRTPTEGAVTNGQGLLVVGNIHDDTQWESVHVRVEDGSQVRTAYRTVEVDPATGDWAFAMPAELLAGTSALTIRVRGIDTRLNAAEQTRTFAIVANNDTLRHLISRATFGESAALWDEARRMGYIAFMDQQLSPASIDDSVAEARLSSVPVNRLGTLIQQNLMRAVISRRQLNEVMASFWDNHFNTDFNRHGRFEREQADNVAFRQHALGRFRDLLGVSARSTAMLMYLDNMHSHKSAPNENYARELLELHAMGEGYTQRDVDEVARAFTGWTVSGLSYVFAPERHDDGEKTVLGQVLLAGGGESDGERVLDMLAERPETARHVCRKLVMRFVADEPPASLVTRCANLFLSQRHSSNQIAQVLRLIFLSTEFREPSNRSSKVKDSVRFVVGALRATEGLRSGGDLPRIVAELAQPQLTYPAPDGYALDSANWTGTYLFRTRLEFIGKLMENHPQGEAVSASPRALLHSWPTVTTTEGVAARVLQNLNGGTFDSSELTAAIASLTDNGSQKFALDAPHADEALTRLVRTALSLPRYQLH